MGPRGGIRVNSPDSYTVSQQKYHSKQIDSRQKKSRNIQEPTRCKTTGVQQPVSYLRQPAVTNNQSTSRQNRYKNILRHISVTELSPGKNTSARATYVSQ